MSRSLFSQNSGNLDSFKMRCFCCNNGVLPQTIEEVKFQSFPGKYDKGFQDNLRKETSKYFSENHYCFLCTEHGHLARSCSAVEPHQGDQKERCGGSQIGGYKVHPGGLTRHLD